MTVALVVQVKDENIYLDEWINHYQKLGINHIYLIDHNDIDGENPNDVIDKYGDYITYIDIRGVNLLDVQSYMQSYIYNMYNNDYDWWCFFDVDEFLELTKDKTIQEYLSRDIFNNVDQIHINWLLYDDNNLIEYEDQPVQERFTHISNIYSNEFDKCSYNDLLKYACKPILRKGFNIRSLVHSFVHINENIKLYTVDSSGLDSNDRWGSCNSPYRYDLCYLKHYSTKSLNEFIYKKFNKIDATNAYSWLFDYYFIINEHTPEKDEYIKKYLNLQKLLNKI